MNRNLFFPNFDAKSRLPVWHIIIAGSLITGLAIALHALLFQ